jgi:cephalosporin-C deacetylase-like acetyl esterase
MKRTRKFVFALSVGGLVACGALHEAYRNTLAAQPGLAAQLRSIQPNLFSDAERKSNAQMLRNDVAKRRDAANLRDAQAWGQVKSRSDWEKFRAPRIDALRRSLGHFPAAPKTVNAHVTRTLDGEGYRIENLVYESRSGVFVSANLYLPRSHQSRLRPLAKIPAILIVHSHHNPKTQAELQDMGMTWARQGCAVLVMDQLGYGDRREHPPGPRQDYRFRYINGVQLYLIGDSLMGWMAWDVMRGVDLLLAREEVDRTKLILMGSVAGGGDPAAVVAAIDPRISCVVPFNFGGPEPESPYPLPADPEKTFNYMGGGSWESTRCLRLSGRDGFLPWVIVASVAPRRLIYAHEFSWDREHDPVWKRLQKVFDFYGASTLAFAHGAGLLSGKPPDATHCNNIGAVHRKMIYPPLERWFGIAPPEKDYQQRRPDEELTSLTPELASRLKLRPMHELFGEIGASRVSAMRTQLRKLSLNEQRQRLRQEWARSLGNIEPATATEMSKVKSEISHKPEIQIERIVLDVEPNIVVPMLLLLPQASASKQLSLVIGLSQEGKEKFLGENVDAIAELLARNVAVCLPDVRGTGETRPDSPRDPQTEATSISATELMLGQTLLGSRLRDLRSVLRYLRARRDLEFQRIALWGDSFASVNPAQFTDPLMGEGGSPPHSEPLGGLLALFGALYEDTVHTVVARRTLAGYQSVLRDRFCYIPHDAIVPGALSAGDLCDVAAALAPRPLRLEGLVDGRNRLMEEQDLRRLFDPTIQAYRAASDKLLLMHRPNDSIAAWLVKSLNTP